MTSTAKRRRADKPRIPLDRDKIRALRKSLKLSQEQAASLAGLSGRQRWYEIESGRETNLTIETLERVAAALGCKARDLLK